MFVWATDRFLTSATREPIEGLQKYFLIQTPNKFKHFSLYLFYLFIYFIFTFINLGRCPIFIICK